MVNSQQNLDDSPFKWVSEAFGYYKLTTQKYEELLVKITELTTVIEHIDDLADKEMVSREFKSLYDNLSREIKTLQQEMKRQFEETERVLKTNITDTSRELTSNFSEHKKELNSGISEHQKNITEKEQNNKTSSETLIKLLNENIQKLTYKLYLIMGLLAIVTSVGLGSLVYIKIVVEAATKRSEDNIISTRSEYVKHNARLFIIDSQGRKVPIIVESQPENAQQINSNASPGSPSGVK